MSKDDGQIFVDSSMTFDEATKQNPLSICPQKVLQRLQLLKITYHSFDNKIHQGQIVIDKDLVKDIAGAFELLLKEKFPLTSVIPISDPRFNWNDELSMQANNSSGFNYRTIAGTDKLSKHALGQAIDINPLLNPYIKGNLIRPRGALYQPQKPGTITENSKIAQFFQKRGWVWGGNWDDRKDYQHFEKFAKI